MEDSASASTKLSLAGVIGLFTFILAVMTATGAACWNIARTHTADRLAQYEQSDEWELPETLTQIRDVSAAAKLDMSERKQFESLRNNQKASEQAMKTLQDELAIEKAQRISLEAELTKYTGETFALKEGESRFIVPKVVAFAVHNCSFRDCQVQLGANQSELEIGMPISLVHDGKKIVVTLISIEEIRGEFGATGHIPRFAISEPQEYKIVD